MKRRIAKKRLKQHKAKLSCFEAALNKIWLDAMIADQKQTLYLPEYLKMNMADIMPLGIYGVPILYPNRSISLIPNLKYP